MAQFKRVMSTLVKGLLAVVLVVAALPAVTGNQYIYRAFRATYLMGHTTANIDDAPVFDQRIVKAGTPQPWPVSPVYNQTPLPADLVAWHEQFGTAAWLVVHDGQVLQERYFAPYNAESRTNSFSMAKTVTTMLAGAAVADGYLLSFDEPANQRIGFGDRNQHPVYSPTPMTDPTKRGMRTPASYWSKCNCFQPLWIWSSMACTAPASLPAASCSRKCSCSLRIVSGREEVLS